MTEAPAAALFQVQCKTCNTFVLVGADTDFHAALKCDCCPQGRDHDHKAAAMACTGSSDAPGPVGHDGAPCGPGVDGCTVCRPIIITPLPGTIAVTGV